MGRNNGKIDSWRNRIVGEGVERAGDLVANPRNWRIHPKHQQDALKGILNEIGWVQRVIVNKRTGYVLDGHLRVALAMREKGDEVEIPVIYVDLDENEEASVLSTLDPISALAGADKDKLEELLHDVHLMDSAVTKMISDLAGDVGVVLADEESPEAPEPQIDKAEELRKKWDVEPGQLWRIASKTAEGEHRIICGDCTEREVIQKLMDITPNIMITDPPYGVQYDASWRDEAAEKGLINFAAHRTGKVENDEKADWREAWRLFPGNIVYCWHAAVNSDIVKNSLEESGFEIRSQIIWAKPHFVISRGHYAYRHEPCWYAIRKGKSADWIGGNKQTTLWEISLDKNVVGGHSTQKPVECMERPIKNHKGSVYDPFLGSGTTLVACERLGRLGRGVEIEPKYVAVSLQRLADMGLEPELVKK